jgi:hypothetical protein
MTGHFDFIALGKVSVEDFVDVYCLNDLSAPPSQEWPYAVSSNHEHEFHINLAFIDIKYRMVKEGVGRNTRSTPSHAKVPVKNACSREFG